MHEQALSHHSDGQPPRRIVITGLGAVTPLGLTMRETWEKLQAGVSGIDYITKCDTADLRVNFAGEVRGFDPAADLRGTYGNPEVCPVGRRYRDNPEPILRAAFLPLPVTDAPMPGDVALVQMRGSPFLFGAVRVDVRNWAMKPETGGLTVTRAVVPVTAWGVGYAP